MRNILSNSERRNDFSLLMFSDIAFCSNLSGKFMTICVKQEKYYTLIEESDLTNFLSKIYTKDQVY